MNVLMVAEELINKGENVVRVGLDDTTKLRVTNYMAVRLTTSQ